MYVASIIVLLFVLPALSVVVDALWLGGSADLVQLVGKWFAFWAVGVRLFVAGVRQVVQPQFTAREIFAVQDPGALPIVREVGFGNLSVGALGVLTLLKPDFLVPAAIVGGLYYGLAGLGHVVRGHRNLAGQAALVTDLFAFVVLAVFVVARGI